MLPNFCIGFNTGEFLSWKVKGDSAVPVPLPVCTQNINVKLLFFREECEAIGELAGVEGTDVYCHRQCMVYPADNCPTDKCKCLTTNDILNEKNLQEDDNSIIKT